MKLSETLIQRADTHKRILQLSSRLSLSVRIMEGEQVPENPEELLAELRQLISTFASLITQINQTNSQTPFDSSRSLTSALAERDALKLNRQILEATISTASGMDGRRSYRYSPLRSFSTVNVSELQTEMNQLSRRYRELDTRIQQINWTTDVRD